MTEANWSTLQQAAYVSLATYRKTGATVATPIWAAPHENMLYAFSAGQAGKVKRLRNSARAQLAVCDVRGRLLGPWREVSAYVITDTQEQAIALAAMRRKYGWQMWLLDVGSKLSGKFSQRAYLRIDPNAQTGTQSSNTEPTHE